ncbi:transcription termination factor Rho [Corynebacterium argentoratense]|mgnify:FL=1|uniref:transcription termination factor Rho n=1 Tax=Corynebacterium argentoratense TaxID=42817 RepID=UPI00248EC385|nr:transcription termination factor Rho [Corynebacterium argentoratense]
MTEKDTTQDLSALRIPELRSLAQSMGIRGLSGLRKGELIDKINAAGGGAGAKEAATETKNTKEESSQNTKEDTETREAREAREAHYESRAAARRARRNRARQKNSDNGDSSTDEQRQERNERPENNNERNDRGGEHNDRNDRNGDRSDRNDRGDRNDRSERGNRRNRRNRRDRDNRDNRDNNVAPEDLQPVAGILDIVDSNVAFVRTTGYHASSADVFVSNQMIRRLGLRRGDAIVGQVKMREQTNVGNGRNRQKYNSLMRVDTINGLSVDDARQRPDFSKLTPLYPNQRLRLETDPKILTTRVIDLIMPIGKGQRALIVSPPKAGKTTILQNIANAIATNNPECYLMVVLVDERPEEVTDMQRSVKGEVIASTFDRPPSEHTTVAELAIERAKRLVEQGQDVVVLLDSITRLGRAYNNSSPASGRILSGGVDSNALYPPKRFLGAARNIENGGSLTIIATAMVETGSAGDTVIFEEFKGTGNAELKLDRKISERRVFPAVDVNPSGTRKDELLLGPDEARLMHKLRRILSALDNQQAIDLLIKQLKKTKNNAEFMMQLASSAPLAAAEDEEN